MFVAACLGPDSVSRTPAVPGRVTLACGQRALPSYPLKGPSAGLHRKLRHLLINRITIEHFR